MFDRYDEKAPLKAATREKNPGDTAPIAYHVSDSTKITYMTHQMCLSVPQKMKIELREYLADKAKYQFDSDRVL